MRKPRQPKISNACKVCKLIKTDPELWEEIHNKVLKEGYSQRSVVKWLNAQLDILNIDRPAGEKLGEFNAQNFSTHFKHHMDSTYAMTLALRNKVLGKQALQTNAPDAFSVEEIAVVENYMQEHQEITDYTKLTKMISTLESALWTQNDRFEKMIEEGRVVNLTQIAQFRDLVNAVADLKLRLSKLRNSSVVAGSAVRKAIVLAVTAFLNQMSEATQDSLNSLYEAFPDGKSTSDDIIIKLREGIGSGMKSTLEEIIKDVFNEFNIK